MRRQHLGRQRHPEVDLRRRQRVTDDIDITVLQREQFGVHVGIRQWRAGRFARREVRFVHEPGEVSERPKERDWKSRTC